MDALPPTDPSRRYTDREVRLILKAAVDLQQRAAPDDEPSSGDGLSLAELERAAQEAGIDPAVVRRAAAALDAVDAPDDDNRLLGAPTEILVERLVDAPLDEADFERLLGVVRAQSRHLGETSTVGRLFGWKGHIDGVKAEVSATPVGARTQVRVRIELAELAMGHFMLKSVMLGGFGGFAGTMFGVYALGLGPIGVLGGGAIVSGGYLWARWGYRSGAARLRTRAHALAAALVAALEAHQAMEQRTSDSSSGPGDRY